MLITIDTEDPELTELLVQFLGDRVKHRMLSVLTMAEPVMVRVRPGGPLQTGLFLSDGAVQQAQVVASDGVKVRGTTKTFTELLTQKLIETLLSFAMIDKKILAESDIAYYSNSLIEWVGKVLKEQDSEGIDAIRSLWDGESWASIQEKLMTEGSTWHVWWMDGLRKYIAIDRGWVTNDAPPGIRKAEEASVQSNHQQESTEQG